MNKDVWNELSKPKRIDLQEENQLIQRVEQQYPPPELKERAKGDINKIITAMVSYADVTIIGDTDHTQSEIFDKIANGRLIKAAAEGGAQHLALEADAKQQSAIVDPLQKAFQEKDQKEEQIRKDFVRNYKKTIKPANNTTQYNWNKMVDDTATMALDAIKLGMQIHFSDTYPQEEADRYEQYVYKNPDKYTEHDRRLASAEWKLARFKDQELAEKIDKDRNGEKALLIYGSDHGTSAIYQKDLNERIKGVVAKIDFYIDKEDLHQHLDGTLRQHGPDQPDLIYFIEDNEIYATPDINPALKQHMTSQGIKFLEVSENPAPKPEESKHPEPDVMGPQSPA